MIGAHGGEPADALDPGLRASILTRHREEAVHLLAQALGEWRSAGYTRFDDREVSCTVRVLDAMLRILQAQEHLDLVQIFPQIEGIEATRDQLAGVSDFSKAKRADLVLYLGGNHSHRMCVECKRLWRSANAHEYTKNGILRFVRGDYSGDQGIAMMVGYVMSKTVPQRVLEINSAVSSHPALGDSHCLVVATPVAPIDDVHRSNHSTGVASLIHLFVDMRERGPSQRQLQSAAS